MPAYLPYAIVLCLLVVGWQLYPVARLHYREQRDLDRLERQLADIRHRNQRLKAEVDRLKTKEGVEEAARELGYSRKGEQVWVTLGAGESSSTATSGAVGTAGAAAGDAWTQALDLIFGVGP